MKYVLILTLALASSVEAATVTVKLQAPTANTDGSAISSPLTYNLYKGSCTSLVRTQKGLTSLTITANAVLGQPTGFQVSAVENGIEGPRSPIYCLSCP